MKIMFNPREITMDKSIYDFMAATIEVAAENPIAPYGAMIVYDDKEVLLKSVNSAHIITL